MEHNVPSHGIYSYSKTRVYVVLNRLFQEISACLVTYGSWYHTRFAASDSCHTQKVSHTICAPEKLVKKQGYPREKVAVHTI